MQFGKSVETYNESNNTFDKIMSLNSCQCEKKVSFVFIYKIKLVKVFKRKLTIEGTVTTANGVSSSISKSIIT